MQHAPPRGWKSLWVLFGLPGLLALLFSRLALSAPGEWGAQAISFAEGEPTGLEARSLAPNEAAPILTPGQILFLPKGIEDSRMTAEDQTISVVQAFSYGGRSFTPNEWIANQVSQAPTYVEPALPYFGAPAFAAMIPDLTIKPIFTDYGVHLYEGAPGTKASDYFGERENASTKSRASRRLSEVPVYEWK